MITHKINGRVSVTNTGKSLWIRHVLPGQPVVFAGIAVSLGLSLCACCNTYNIYRSYIDPVFLDLDHALFQDDTFYLSLAGFAAVFLFAIWSAAHGLFHEDIIDIDPTALLISSRPKWLRFGWPARVYPVTETSELVVGPPFHTRFGVVEGGISFKHRGRLIRFVPTVTSSEAQQIIDLVLSEYPIYGLPLEERKR